MDQGSLIQTDTRVCLHSDIHIAIMGPSLSAGHKLNRNRCKKKITSVPFGPDSAEDLLMDPMLIGVDST